MANVMPPATATQHLRHELLAPLPPGSHDFRDRRVCVTGGAGFIGSHLVDALLERGAEVAVLDDFSNGSEANLAAATTAHASRLRVIRGALGQRAVLDSAFDGADVIFHLAALGSVPMSVDAPRDAIEHNVHGTFEVLEAARRAGARRVVYASSSAWYGALENSPKEESMPPDALSPYAASKAAGELLMRSWAVCYGLSTVSLRYFNIFGPRQRADSPYAAVIPRFIEAMRAGRRPVIHGTGQQTRDFCFVANVVWANLLAGSAARALAGEAANIGSGRGTSLLELLGALAARLDRPAAADHEPARPGDPLHSIASIARAEALLGYRPIVGFEEGLERTLSG